MKMDKKKWIILGCGIAVIGIFVLVLVLTGRQGKIEKVTLFADSDYPLEYYEKDGNLIFLLHGSRSGRITSSGLSWMASVADDAFAGVSVDDGEKDAEIAFIVQPKKAGKTELSFIRKTEVEGFAYEAVRLTIPVYIAKSGEGFSVSCANGYTIEDAGGDIGGASTEVPYVLLNEEDGTGKILFVNGLSDWELTGDTDLVNYQEMGVDNSGNIFFRVVNPNAVKEEDLEDDSEVSADAGDTEEQKTSEKGKEKTVILSMSSEENQVKEDIEVTLDAEGKVSLRLKGQEEKRKK